MEYPAAETLILNDDEMVLMLAAAGITEWYGIDLKSEADRLMSDSAVNACLAGLYRKGLVDWADGRARIAGSARPVFKTLKRSAVCITSTGRNMPGLVNGSYCVDSEVVMIERSVTSDRELKLTLMTPGEWVENFEKEGLFPKAAEPAEGVKPGKGTPDEEDLVSRFEVRKIPGGELIETVSLYDSGIYGIIVRKNNKNARKEMFRPEAVRAMMRGWAGGTAR